MAAVSEDDLADCVRYGILTWEAATGLYEASPAMQLVAAADCGPSAIFRDGPSFERIVAVAAARGAEVAGCHVLHIQLRLPLPAQPGDDSEALVQDFAPAVAHLQLSESRAVVFVNARNAQGPDVIVLRKIVAPRPSGSADGPPQMARLEVECIGCKNTKDSNVSLHSRFWTLGADPSTIPVTNNAIFVVSEPGTRRDDTGNPQRTCLALVALLRAAAAAVGSPPADPSQAIGASTDPRDPPIDVALRSIPGARQFTTLAGAAAMAAASTSTAVVPVSIRYVLYESDTGRNPAAPANHAHYWTESAVGGKRNGLNESFWVVRRGRMGPFAGLVTDPEPLKKMLSAPKPASSPTTKRSRRQRTSRHS